MNLFSGHAAGHSPEEARAYFREVEKRTALLNPCGITIVGKRMI